MPWPQNHFYILCAGDQRNCDLWRFKFGKNAWDLPCYYIWNPPLECECVLCGVGPVLDVTGQQGPLSSILAAACSITVPSPDNSQHYTTKTAQYVAFKLMILAIASRPSVSLPLCRAPFAGKFDSGAINSGQYIGHLLVAASFASCPTATFSRRSDGRLLAPAVGRNQFVGCRRPKREI